MPALSNYPALRMASEPRSLTDGVMSLRGASFVAFITLVLFGWIATVIGRSRNLGLAAGGVVLLLLAVVLLVRRTRR